MDRQVLQQVFDRVDVRGQHVVDLHGPRLLLQDALPLAAFRHPQVTGICMMLLCSTISGQQSPASIDHFDFGHHSLGSLLWSPCLWVYF